MALVDKEEGAVAGDEMVGVRDKVKDKEDKDSTVMVEATVYLSAPS